MKHKGDPEQISEAFVFHLSKVDSEFLLPSSYKIQKKYHILYFPENK